MIFLVGLALFGPKKLPQLSEDVANALQRFLEEFGHARPIAPIPVSTLIPLSLFGVLFLVLLVLCAR